MKKIITTVLLSVSILSVDAQVDKLAGPRVGITMVQACLLYTSPSPRDGLLSRMPSSA